MKIALVAVIFLAGCTTAVPIKRTFPEAPPILMKKCSDLQTVPEGTSKLSDVLTNVTTNYSTFHECQIQLEAWQQWYGVQKKVFEEAN